MLNEKRFSPHNDKNSTTQEKKRLLLIDDVESIAMLYATILRFDGYMIQIVSSLEEAKRNLPTFQPHAIIVTLEPLQAEGIKLNALSALNDAAPDIPIIAISVLRTPDLMASPHISAYLILPFKIKKLRETVKSQIDLSTHSASANSVTESVLNYRHLADSKKFVYPL